MQYRYDRSGLPVEQRWSNGAVTTTEYDAAQRPLRIELARGAVVVNRTEYAYDANGNRTEERINRAGGAQVTSYTYDQADRLTQTQRVEGSTSVTTSWTYDRADNRKTETVATSSGTATKTYSYDARHQLKRVDDSAAGATVLSYDAQGNLKQKQIGSQLTTYEWNARDLLSQVSRNGTVLGRYGSDHAGLRVNGERKVRKAKKVLVIHQDLLMFAEDDPLIECRSPWWLVDQATPSSDQRPCLAAVERRLTHHPTPSKPASSSA